MADFKGRKRGKSHVQNMGIFLVVQDVVLSHRAKFQLIINFFRGKAISTGLEVCRSESSKYTTRVPVISQNHEDMSSPRYQDMRVGSLT